MAEGGKSPVTGREGTERPRNMGPGKLTDIQLPSLAHQQQQLLQQQQQQLLQQQQQHPHQQNHQQQRPSLNSQYSSSLPSTPHVHARKLSDEYRTPPLAARTAAQDVSSPRSARSESDGNVRPTARAPSISASYGCKYETGMAFSRRRVPYSIGGDVLEPVAKVKKSLDPAEEEKLSGDMRTLYDRLIPSTDGEERRAKFVKKLEKIINDRWPGHNIKVHVFGSSGNLLCSNDSDVDICITTTMKALARVCNLAKALAEHGMERVVCVPSAKVPIVKIWDPELKLACDMNVNNTLALENTRMIRTYVQIDPRVRQLAMVIKHWTRRRVLNDAALGGTLSSYTWICMIINFLQTRHPPILPNLQGQKQQPAKYSSGRSPPFNDDLNSLKGFGDANKETIGELLFHFFRRYGHEIDYEKNIISIRTGGLISKQAKKWHLMQNNRLCVEEPFNIERNLGNTADDISFRGVHGEIRRAFDLIAQAKLDMCCDEYVFPPLEEKTWTKPAPQPRPILTRSLSQQGRGARSNGNGPNSRSSNKNRTGTSNRRASSAAAMNKLPPFSLGPSSAPLQLTGERLSGSQIHAQLIHQYQFLQAQEQQLRMQMQERAQQVQLGAHAAAQLQPIQIPASAMPQQTSFDGLRHPNIEPAPLSAPLRAVPTGYYPLQLTPQLQGHRFMAPSTPSQSSTNPPSPTMSNTHPLSPGAEFPRNAPRSHRGLTTNEDNSTIRSHSQPPGNSVRGGTRPPRHLGQFYHNPIPQGQALGATALAQFQQLYLQAKMGADLQRPQLQSPPADGLGLRPVHLEPHFGYTVDPNMPYGVLPNGLDNGMPSLHPGDGSGGRPRRASVSPNISRVRSQTPRSGSPSNSTAMSDPSNYFPAFSLSQTSHPATSASSDTMSMTSANGQAAQNRSGPLIVDGSSEADYTPPRETAPWTNGRSDAASYSSEPSRAMSISTSPRRSSPPSAETSMPHTPPSHSTLLQFGDFPARATLRNNRTTRGNAGSGGEAAPEPKGVSLPPKSAAEKPPTGLGIEIGGELQPDATPNAVAAAKPETPQKAVKDSSAAAATGATLPLKPDGDERPPVFLSPVREVRTPSPTVTRLTHLPRSGPKPAEIGGRSIRAIESTGSPQKPPASSGSGESRLATSAPLSPVRNGVVVQQAQAGLADAAALAAANYQPPPPPPPPQQQQQQQQLPVPNPLQTGGWQQSVNKKTKKNRRAGSSGGVTAPAAMVSEVERKGG